MLRHQDQGHRDEQRRGRADERHPGRDDGPRIAAREPGSRRVAVDGPVVAEVRRHRTPPQCPLDVKDQEERDHRGCGEPVNADPEKRAAKSQCSRRNGCYIVDRGSGSAHPLSPGPRPDHHADGGKPRRLHLFRERTGVAVSRLDPVIVWERLREARARGRLVGFRLAVLRGVTHELRPAQRPVPPAPWPIPDAVLPPPKVGAPRD
jgi:hypothetical protein